MCYLVRHSAPSFCYTYVFLLCRFVQDMVHSNHLGKNGAIAERVAQCIQPTSELV